DLFRTGREILSDFYFVIESQGREYGIPLHQFGEFHRGLSQCRHFIDPEAARQVERKDDCEWARENRFIRDGEEIDVAPLSVLENLDLIGPQVPNKVSSLVRRRNIHYNQIRVDANRHS